MSFTATYIEIRSGGLMLEQRVSDVFPDGRKWSRCVDLEAIIHPNNGGNDLRIRLLDLSDSERQDVLGWLGVGDQIQIDVFGGRDLSSLSNMYADDIRGFLNSRK